MTGDGEVGGGRGFVGNRSEVTGEIVVRLRRVIAELHHELLEQVNELRSDASVRLRVHRHYPIAAGARLLRRHFRHGSLSRLLCSQLTQCFFCCFFFFRLFYINR